MPITTQKYIPGVTTESPPAATSLGDEYYLAWTNADATISWTTLSVNGAGNDYNNGTIYTSKSPLMTGFHVSRTASYALTIGLSSSVWKKSCAVCPP